MSEVNACYKCKTPSHKRDGKGFYCRACGKFTPSIELRDRMRAVMARVMKQLQDNPSLVQQLKEAKRS